MAVVPPNVILIWTGNNDVIPTGWIRETALDGKHIKSCGDSVAPNQLGGSNTHTHTSTAHGHTMNNHQHTGVTGAPVNENGVYKSTECNNDGGSERNHTHNWASSTTTGGELSSDVVPFQTGSNEPPYFEVIFIKPNGVPIGIKAGIVGLWNSDTLPAVGYNYCDGDAGRPDLRNKYLKGASTGANGGATGGSLTHTHDITHSHTSTAQHSHVGSTTSYNGSQIGYDTGWLHYQVVKSSHTHTITLANQTTSHNSYSGSITSGNVEPAFKKLHPIIASGNSPLPKGLIGLWIGSIASIPKGWQYCNGGKIDGSLITSPDMRDLYLKLKNGLADSEVNGGANTHQHVAVGSHTHVASGTHSHSYTVSQRQTDQEYLTQNNGCTTSDDQDFHHWHYSNTCDSVTPTWANQTLTSDVVSNEPAHRTVAFIQFQYATEGGFFLENFC